MEDLTKLEPLWDELGGEVSIWLGRPGSRVVYERDADQGHYPASTMKIGVMAAAYRLADAGRLDLDAEIPVHSEFTSAVGGTFSMDRGYDSDSHVWDRVGQTAPLRWLIRRMIVRSSNLATNLVLEQTGYSAAQEAYRLGDDTRSITRRGIEDYAARDAGVDNEVTARDLARQLSAIELGEMASAEACAEMLDVLKAQELNEDFARGLPDGVPLALKNGWIEGIRHSAAIVYPEDAPSYVLVACASTPKAHSDSGDDDVCRGFAQLSRVVWEARHRLG